MNCWHWRPQEQLQELLLLHHSNAAPNAFFVQFPFQNTHSRFVVPSELAKHHPQVQCVECLQWKDLLKQERIGFVSCENTSSHITSNSALEMVVWKSVSSNK